MILGGFSSFFNRPAYQDDAINNYFNTLTKQPNPGFNKYGRGIPDISLIGVNYTAFSGGEAGLYSGTSASAPTFAGMISLINSKRINIGLNTVGFINPTLYKYANNIDYKNIFNDIIIGNNYCCANSNNDTTLVCCQSGFEAIAGWDAITGLGSINYPQLYDILIPNNNILTDFTSFLIIAFTIFSSLLILLIIGYFMREFYQQKSKSGYIQLPSEEKVMYP